MQPFDDVASTMTSTRAGQRREGAEPRADRCQDHDQQQQQQQNDQQLHSKQPQQATQQQTDSQSESNQQRKLRMRGTRGGVRRRGPGGPRVLSPPLNSSQAMAPSLGCITSVRRDAWGGAVEARPDRQRFEDSMAGISSEISQLRSAMKCLDVQIARHCGCDDEEFEQRKASLKDRLDLAAKALLKLDKLREQLLRGEDDELLEEGRKRAELKKLKAAVGFADEDEIDEQISVLEGRMWEQQLSLAEEKSLLNEIASLGRKKCEVLLHREMEANLRGDDQIVSDRLALFSRHMEEQQEAKQKAAQQYRLLIEERQLSLADLPCTAERQACGERLEACLRRQSRLREAFQRQEHEVEAYQAGLQQIQRQESLEANRREQLRTRREAEVLRQREREERLERHHQDQTHKEDALLKRRLEEKARREEKASEADKSAGVEHEVLPKEPPHFAEFRLLEQTRKYCQTLIPKKADNSVEKKPVQYNNPEGSFVIVPKEERAEDYLVTPSKPRRHEGKVNKRPMSSRLKKSRLEGNQVLMLTPLSLRLFEA
ncbi:unnamed protein product [Polarella glacialis]|uniref:Uncharacterized protein n=1 Tax=Polarella glacialis TaxID=89957 RepID=A0A813LHY2_POLGL|nr:unnamed protein product [Polarella glacialis]